MDSIFEVKEKLAELYASKSKIIDKVLKFILGICVFACINSNVGFMKMAASPIITLGLSVLCAFLPMIIMILAAAALLLVHLFSLSLGLGAVAAISILIMFVFYFRFTPKQALILLLTPVLFWLKIPYVMPIAYGLVGTPMCMIPVGCGTILYYIIVYAKTNASNLRGGSLSGIIDVITSVAKGIYSDKGMWVYVIAFAICLTLVYTLKRMSVDHSWKIAIATGAIVNIIAIMVGGSVMGAKVPIGMVVIGNVVAIGICLILELFVFSVDYTRTEKIEFEDDEYFYYVKAIPKINVSKEEKRVHRIQGHGNANRRRREPVGEETMVLDSEHVEAQMARQQAARRRTTNSRQRTDEELLQRSIRDELDL